MKIEKISYQKAFVIGPYLQEKIGVEIILDEGENMDEAFLLAKSTVENWNKAHNIPLEEVAEPTMNLEDERIEVRIENCNSIEELATYKANLPATLLAVYMNKLKELTKKIK